MRENLNDTLTKINELLKERNWSYYKLANAADIPYSSLNSMFLKNTHPTLPTLEKICNGLHISMAEFFSDEPPYRENSYQFSEEELALIGMYRELSLSERKMLLSYVKGFCHKPLS